MFIMNFEDMHRRTAHLHHESVGLVVDTAEVAPGKFETMAMTPSGKELSCRISFTLEDAERDYNELLKKHFNHAAPKKETGTELKGKYAKFRDDLRTVLEQTERLEKTEDGGTCNFDAPAVALPRWTEKMVEQAIKEAGGTGAWKWNLYGHNRFVIGVRSSGQANRRSRRAEAIAKLLKEMGYDASVYYAMD